MTKRLRKDGRIVRKGGKLARERCRTQCCGPGPSDEFYLARRCDIVYPPPVPLPIPPEVPPDILIQATYFCSGESCEIEGGRLILYGGYCYMVVGSGRNQPPPCEDKALAQRYILSQFDPVPPIADPLHLTCKPPGSLCDEECIPQAPPGSCCFPSNIPCASQSDRNPECWPCDCPSFHKYALVATWNHEFDEFDQFGVQQIRLRSSGNIAVQYECEFDEFGGVRVVATGSGGVNRACTVFPPCTGACDGVPYVGPPEMETVDFLRFGDVPRALLDRQQLVGYCAGQRTCAGCDMGFQGVNPPEHPCSCQSTRPDPDIPGDHCISTTQATQEANCYGGRLVTGGRVSTVFVNNVTWYTWSTNFQWAWVPLVRCADDPNPILAGAPLGRGGHRSTALTKGLIRSILDRFAPRSAA